MIPIRDFLYFPHSVDSLIFLCYHGSAAIFRVSVCGNQRPPKAAERHEVHMKKSKTMDDTKKARRKQLILVLVNVFLLLAVVAVIALLIVRSDWRYGLFERFRSRNPAQAERMQLVDSDCRTVSLHDLLEGQTEGTVSYTHLEFQDEDLREDQQLIRDILIDYMERNRRLVSYLELKMCIRDRDKIP